MNKDVTVNTLIKMPAYVKVDFTDIDAIARAFDMHKHVCIIIYSQIKNYTSIPTFDINLPIDFGHGVTIVDRFLYNGEKAFLMDDSWGWLAANHIGIGNGSQRILTESFLKLAIRDAVSFVKVPEEIAIKPKYFFTKPLMYGMTSNIDVKALQNILTYEGFFPAGVEYHTGNMFQITTNALKKWQVAHGIMDFANEQDLKNVIFGKKSIALANSLYQ